MNLRTIEASLLAEEEKDFLVFQINSDESLRINLNSAECQNELKNLFSKLLSILLDNDIRINFKNKDDYPRKMYTEICKEYIKDLNQELDGIKDELRTELEK